MKRIFVLTAGLAVFLSAQADVRLPKFFSDNMVLQRERPIRVWGEASKGETVTVRFAGAEASATADRTGRWEATLPAMKADATPREMTVAGRSGELRFTNVVVGDVWLCSGQSNMEWRLEPTTGCKAEIAASANPNIRLLTVAKTIAFEEQRDIDKGSWVECTPETSRRFSAVGYYFGKFIQAETGVPVGLINSSWGGTDIETWTSWGAMRTSPEYGRYADEPSPREAIGRELNYFSNYKAALADDRGDRERWYDPAVAASPKQWRTMTLPQPWEKTLGAVDGRVWFRKTVVLPVSAEGASAVLHLPAVDDNDETYVNGRRVGATRGWTLARRYEIPAGVLHEGENLVAVRAEDTGGDGGIWGDAKEMYLEIGGERCDLAGDWLFRPSATTAMFGITNGRNYDHPNSFASLLYNSMIAPLVGYGIKGVVWYQGENNAARAQSYRRLFPQMIRDWREKWGYEFPFFWVQLANYMQIKEQPGQSEWAELREAQNLTLALPATGQAVITDIGDANDIHPRNKRDVGYRLSRAALNVAYGRTGAAAGGPAYRSMKREGDRIVLTFDAAGALKPADGNRYGYLHGFTIAGADGKFVWAKAYIRDAETVVVFADGVTDPAAVRYGWADNPQDDDLTDASGLLASPFRTDDWPGITK